MNIRVVIAEEKNLIREALAGLLQTQGSIEVVGQTADPGEAVDLVRDSGADVLLVGAPADGGIAVSRAIVGAGLTARVLVVATTRQASSSRLLAAGAAGYVNADASGSDLIAAVNRVHAGERVTHADDEQRDPVAVLSPRELETLRFLAAGMTNREIAARLGISVKTIDTHRGHVLKKLSLRNNADLTRFAIEYGLVDLDSHIDRGPQNDNDEHTPHAAISRH